MNIFDSEGEALEAMNLIPFELHPAIQDCEGEGVAPMAMEHQILQQELKETYKQHSNELSLSERQVRPLARTALKRLFI